MIFEQGCIKGFSKDETYIIGKSLIDAWGYPYKPKKIRLLQDTDEYKNVDELLTKNGYEIELKNLPIVLNALELLYFEHGDFEALYDDVTREDVKLLFEKLKKLADSNK